jgi:hypothetical protein
MDAIVNGIQAVGGYLYSAGQAIVVGASDTVVTFGEGAVNVLKAIFTGAGIGG